MDGEGIVTVGQGNFSGGCDGEGRSPGPEADLLFSEECGGGGCSGGGSNRGICRSVAEQENGFAGGVSRQSYGQADGRRTLSREDGNDCISASGDGAVGLEGPFEEDMVKWID